MVILIGNQKGGAGKSTFTLLLSNYLVQQRNRKVTVLDMDYQQSLFSKFEKAKILENEPLYEVVPASLEHFPAISKAMKSRTGELMVLDLPGKMDDDGLIPLFKAADLVICPFSFDELSVDSTVLFSMVIRKINGKVPMVFVPNRVKGTVRYETRTEIESVIRNFGMVVPELGDRVDFQRISTIHTPIGLIPATLPVLDLIYQQFIDREGTQ